jgi:N4-gp56 family major capsid protein
MADSRASTGLTPEQWDDQFFVEYLSENRYSGEMGTDEASIIQVKENLSKKAGDRINFALVNKATQDAVTGRGTMEGNEEDMASRSFEVAVDKRRNAVRVAEVDEQFSAISLRDAGKHVLKEWSLKDTEKLISQALGSINGVTLAASTESQRDAWLTDNTDRVYDPSATNGTDHSAIWDALDTTNDRLTAADVSAMKYMAQVTASPKIRPIRNEANGRHYYILYCDPRSFRDLKNESSSPIAQAQREVMLEMENNRLFKGGDLLWDGVIIKEVIDIYDQFAVTLTNEGASATAEVAVNFLCGAQAVGVAYARRWKTTTQDFDYGDKHGIEISSIYGVGKMQFGSGAADRDDLKDHGVVTGYFATVT